MDKRNKKDFLLKEYLTNFKKTFIVYTIGIQMNFIGIHKERIYMKRMSLISRIIVCLILGIGVGLICSKFELIFPIEILATLGTLFKNFLSFVIPLIILAFIGPGIASLGSKSSEGLLLTTAIAYISTILAGFLAYIAGSNILPKLITVSKSLEENVGAINPMFTIEMPPIMGVMSSLILAFILGIGLSRIKESIFLKVAEEFNEIILMVVSKIIIPLVPIYIGCIFAELSYTGEIFNTLKTFGIVYIVLLILQFVYLIIQYLIAGSVGKKNPLTLLKNEFPAYMTAAGTQSSAATIPVNLECVKKNGVSDDVAEFVVPLCATIHIAGDTITLVLTSMAVMCMNGQDITFGKFLPFILMLGVTKVAAPGVPGGGVMAALGLLQDMFGFGQIQQSLMIALHSAQDSFGTGTNVTGDGAIAVLIDTILNKKSKKNK